MAFPQFKEHEQASCFNCGGDFNPAYPFKSGFPHGHGEFEQHCEKCRMTTYYDLLSDSDWAPIAQS